MENIFSSALERRGPQQQFIPKLAKSVRVTGAVIKASIYNKTGKAGNGDGAVAYQCAIRVLFSSPPLGRGRKKDTIEYGERGGARVSFMPKGHVYYLFRTLSAASNFF